MSCMEWEARVALHAGGDLAADEAAAVERHLAECPDCRADWSGLCDSLAMLQAAHAELPESAHFTAVRSRVLAEIESGRRRWWSLAWIPAAAMMSAAIALALLWPRGPVPQAPRILAAIPAAPLAIPAPPRAPRVARAAVPKRVLLAQAAPPHHREPLTIKLQTADPNIVIYWIAD